MKKIIHLGLLIRLINLSLIAMVLFFSLNSCIDDYLGIDKEGDSDDTIPVVQSGNSSGKKLLYCYRKNSSSWSYQSKDLTSQAGNVISSYVKSTDWDPWGVMAGIEVGSSEFIFGHNAGDNSYNKDFVIHRILGDGSWGAVTQSGTWENNYETVFGFKLGNRGFLFGQDSYSDHHWFVQEVFANGYLAANESDNGTWNNFYESATPIYVNGKTFLFFQTTSSDNYWFIAYVSQDGKLYDVCDGYWGNFWEAITSVEVNGKAYIIGCRDRHTMTDHCEWFVQRINDDGTMGAETDRGTWSDNYNHLTGYSYNGKAYIFGYYNHITAGGHWFTQEITADGKMGTETSSGNLDDDDYIFFYPFPTYDPGSFRYEIGWDLSKSTGVPARSWSGIFSDPWSGDMKLGSGAALANIDGDASGKYDAVLVGIQDRVGEDRFYYKVAWNLDGTGKASSWSKTLFGPYCAMSQAGGGADIADIDRNGIPDLLFMSVDDPEGVNSFRYNIGWNMAKDGKVASWSNMIQGPSIGNSNSGGGAALGDIDKNGLPDLVLMGVDNPEKGNSFWYCVGKNLDKTGKPTAWTPAINAPCYLGWSSAGGGAALADINGNGKLDLILSGVDSPTGANTFWCYLGWDIDINGNVTGWSPKFSGPATGNITYGGGTAVGDINKNGIMDMLLMTVDNPYGKD